MSAGSPALEAPGRFRAVSVAQMRELDRRAIQEFGIPGAVLMENAGRAISDALRAVSRKINVVVFCGSGNNGGDGLVAARHLANAGRSVKLVLARPPARFQGEALVHWRPVARMRLPFVVFQSRQKLLRFLGKSALAVDALLGTGARSPLNEPYRALIGVLNDFLKTVVAVDVPSGLNADTGRPEDVAVRADLTITMGLPKRGLLAPGARRWTGRLRVADIGFPRPLLGRFLKI
jgi:NAD(P)H-hydrate epimerase